MKLLLLPLILLPLLVQSQSIKVDGERLFYKESSTPKLYKLPEVPKNIGATTDTLPKTTTLEYYLNTPWRTHTTELVKGKIETPVNVMDSGMKVEVVETRDTIYKCPYSNITYFTYDGSISDSNRPRSSDCKLDKIVTTRRYKLYIINEYGQKEYLSVEFNTRK